MNIKKYYYCCFLKEFMPIYPLYLLMFEERVSVAEISALLAIWSIPAVLLEIPTGIIADRISRKWLIFLGMILQAGCYVTWIFADSFLLYAAGFLLWGIGGSFRSGSEEALIYDSLKINGQEERFDDVYGKGRFWSGLSTMLACVLGGFVGMHYGFRPALYLSVFSGLLGAVIVSTMKEVNLYKEGMTSDEVNTKNDTFISAFKFLFHKKEMFLFSLLALLVVTVAGVLDEYDQLIAEKYGLTITLIGVWSSVRFVLMSVGGYLAVWIRKGLERIVGRGNKILSFALLCLAAAGSLMIAGLVRQLGVMVLYGLFYLIMAAGDVLQENYIQQQIGEEGRSTVHSLLALSQNLYGILCFALFGLLLTHTDLLSGLVWAGVYILFWTLVIGVLHRILTRSVKRTL